FQKLPLNRATFLVAASWFAVITWVVTICVLSSMSGQDINKMAPAFWDKGAHFIAFAAGAVALTTALRLTTEWSWRRVILVAIIALSAFGAADEYHQRFTPGRTGADVQDWMADALGAAAGAIATYLIYGRFSRKSAPAPAGD
ncbi:MAG TPA: VanZ family protein, partial [Chthoniobacteraceae bacterium]